MKSDLPEKLRKLATHISTMDIASPEAHLMNEAAYHIEKLEVSLGIVVKWADSLALFADANTVLVPALQQAKDTLGK